MGELRRPPSQGRHHGFS